MSTAIHTCGFEGNTDLYGIGVRVGLYLQWVTTLLTTLFSPADEEVLRIINMLVQSAVFFGLLFLTSRDRIHAVEPVIIIWLIFGALSSLSGSGMSPLGRYSGVYRVLLYTAVAGYACWFWFVGLDGLLERTQSGCRPIAFFGRISISGRFRIFNKVASAVGLAICFAFIIISMITIVKRWTSSERHRRSGRATVEVAYLFISIAIIGFSIAAIEYLLLENNIVEINQADSVGQLIPLLIGAFAFAEIFSSVLRKKLYRKPRCWVLFGRHLS